MDSNLAKDYRLPRADVCGSGNAVPKFHAEPHS
jgi:hypothetical protein